MTNREGDVSGQETLPAQGSIRVAAATLRAGEVVLGKYEIKSAIGVGGMGQVFRARHLRLERDVAVKVLPENGSEEHAMRFEREAALMTRVRHPNVVEILDFGFVHGRMPCIVMELVEGEALSARIERQRALPWADAVRVILGVLDGLEAVHEAQIIHRDLKPSNVAIAKGTPEVVKLLDFGIARSLMPSEGDRRVTRTGNIVGSLDYMSPEALVNDPIDERTDVYSAGMMLFEMLTGGFPFRDDAMAAAFRRLSTDPPLPVAPATLEAIPLPIAEIAQSAIARERKERPSGADDFARQLREQALKLKKSSGERGADRPQEPQKPTAELQKPSVEPQKPSAEPQKPSAEPPTPPRARIATPIPTPNPTPPTPPPKRVLKGVVVEAPKPPPVAPPKPPVVHPTAPKIDTRVEHRGGGARRARAVRRRRAAAARDARARRRASMARRARAQRGQGLRAERRRVVRGAVRAQLIGGREALAGAARRARVALPARKGGRGHDLRPAVRAEVQRRVRQRRRAAGPAAVAARHARVDPALRGAHGGGGSRLARTSTGETSRKPPESWRIRSFPVRGS
jgi:serine/threonine protein kinase